MFRGPPKPEQGYTNNGMTRKRTEQRHQKTGARAHSPKPFFTKPPFCFLSISSVPPQPSRSQTGNDREVTTTTSPPGHRSSRGKNGTRNDRQTTIIWISFEPGIGAYQGLAQKQNPLFQYFLLLSAFLSARGRFQNLLQTPVCTKLRLKRFSNNCEPNDDSCRIL